jgi:hypothetical protein
MRKKIYFYVLSIITGFFFVEAWPTLKGAEISFIVKLILGWLICFVIALFSAAFSSGIFRERVEGLSDNETYEVMGAAFLALLIISLFLFSIYE